ncbi:mannose-6-phosphate isomerase-like protein (cupin superfamily) [Mucilaginibacter gracilis]|uniref:Mannose-6-phosphate isomerase-like protein (Cupin superfamily) n=1 Tax=Mucilaginibacter gracilis TaxID=423350 RepID=A0A495J6S8_9SPHI|nr:cupin domain-containing protein [Mucilaginibacter gracilis]RKR84696.1 mannose-6-phosphate isomerase-like protein (cupin superfamily) [Mucilaginibacter gracilis]
MKDSVDLLVDPVKGFHSNIERDVMENINFRKVLYTSVHMQVVLMTLKPGEEIGEEIHNANDQFFRFEIGIGKCTINGTEYDVSDGDAIVVPAGAKHNVVNTSTSAELKMYTIYAPANHKDGIVRVTKAEAEDFPEKFDGETTE